MTDTPVTQVFPAPTDPSGVTLDDPFPPLPAESDEWPVRTVSRGLRLRVPTAILLALLVAGGAFWGGAALEKSHAGSATGFGAFAGRLRGATTGTTGKGTTGTGTRGGGFFGASTAAATGTVTVVEGNTIFVTSASGTIVKVVVSSSTKVTRDATSSLPALRPGDTVIVEGAKSSSGTVTATSVAATEAGVTAATGFGG
jgi:hypothetical protein